MYTYASLNICVKYLCVYLIFKIYFNMAEVSSVTFFCIEGFYAFGYMRNSCIPYVRDFLYLQLEVKHGLRSCV